MRIILLLSFLLLHVCCQGQYIQSFTLSAAGNSGAANGPSYVSHVIGQSSTMVGTARNGNVVVRQGFKQPFASKNLTASKTSVLVVAEPLPTIHAEVFPNPFVDQVQVRFSTPTRTPTRLTLYDAMSQVIWEREYPENLLQIPLTGFQEIRAGKYFLQIFQHGNPIVKTIIKEVQP